MSDLDMDAAAAPLDLAHAPVDIITIVLQIMSLSDRFTCALVCKAATAATRSIILRDSAQVLDDFMTWLEKHGKQITVLQLHDCPRTALTALPCPQLQDLLLHGRNGLNIDSRVWDDLAAATKLTSASFAWACTASQQADMVSALTALPDLQQLTWRCVRCSDGHQLSDSSLLQQLTQLTALELHNVVAAALQHLSSLTKLQRLSVTGADAWAAAGCPGLQEVKAMTSLELSNVTDIPASVTQMSALQQLDVFEATLAALVGLQALTGLTQLLVLETTGLSPALQLAATLQLPALQHLELNGGGMPCTLPMSFLCKCTQLRVLKLWSFTLRGPGSLLASTMLQHMELGCRVDTADGATDPVSWQQVFPGLAQLPHLTSLHLSNGPSELQHSDIEQVVSCCSSIQVLRLDTLQDSFASTLSRLSRLTSLHLYTATDQQYRSLAQLTGLRELGLGDAWDLSAAGLRQLAAAAGRAWSS